LGQGKLQLQVVAAGGAVLVPDAVVILSDENNVVLHELITDETMRLRLVWRLRAKSLPRTLMRSNGVIAFMTRMSVRRVTSLLFTGA
jgi:hypothetical protein